VAGNQYCIDIAYCGITVQVCQVCSNNKNKKTVDKQADIGNAHGHGYC
jgi:hypothetical protein